MQTEPAHSSIHLFAGVIELDVTEVDRKRGDLVCKVVSGGMLSDHKGVNLPSKRVAIDVLTEKDRADLKRIAELGATASTTSSVHANSRS
mgnify:CR=1 FL=1